MSPNRDEEKEPTSRNHSCFRQRYFFNVVEFWMTPVIAGVGDPTLQNSYQSLADKKLGISVTLFNWIGSVRAHRKTFRFRMLFLTSYTDSILVWHLNVQPLLWMKILLNAPAGSG